MAEAFSLASSIIGVASAGIKLSTTLYQFTESAINADRAIKDIARDLSITSSVITRFGTLLGEQATGNAGNLRADNDTTLKTARDAVNGCNEVFKEIQKELDKYVDVDDDENERRPMANALRRLKWPIVQHKFIALHSRLERLKNTLVLTLNVVSYASRTSISEIEPSIGGGVDHHRRQIDTLILLNEQANARYRGLEKTLERIESMHIPPEATALPSRVDSGVQLDDDDDEIATCDPNDAATRTIDQLVRAPAVTNNSIDEIEQEASVGPMDAFQITQEDLSTCADQARLFLKAVEDAKSSGAQPSQCEEVRKAYFNTFQALQGVFPPQQPTETQPNETKPKEMPQRQTQRQTQQKEQQQRPTGLRRLFSKRLRNS